MFKILVIRDSALGDVILATGIIRKLHQQYNGNCQIDVSTRCPNVFSNNPYINNLVNQFNASDYDKVIDLNWVYELSPSTHILDAYSTCAFGSVLDDLKPGLFPTDDDLVDIPAPYLVLHMRHHYWAARNLPSEFYFNLVSNILDKTELSVVLIGGEHDLSWANPNTDRIIDRVRQLSLHQTYSLIDRAKAFIGVDSAPLHIAACTETPIIGLFTQVRGEYREPKYRTAGHINIASNIDCYGCVETYPPPYINYHCRRGDEECTRQFDPSKVVTQLQQLI